jgi:threonine/homoserine/homoserine lactone efflux protein
MIIFFAMSEIVAGFSSFSETVSWVIGLGMALIAGATKIIYLLASVMGITAGIGAVGIMIIILAAIGAAVILNLGIGGSMKAWRMKRQVDIKKHKVAQGFETAAAGVRGAKTLAEAGAEGEK